MQPSSNVLPREGFHHPSYQMCLSKKSLVHTGYLAQTVPHQDRQKNDVDRPAHRLDRERARRWSESRLDSGLVDTSVKRAIWEPASWFATAFAQALKPAVLAKYERHLSFQCRTSNSKSHECCLGCHIWSTKPVLQVNPHRQLLQLNARRIECKRSRFSHFQCRNGRRNDDCRPRH